MNTQEKFEKKEQELKARKTVHALIVNHVNHYTNILNDIQKLALLKIANEVNAPVKNGSLKK